MFVAERDLVLELLRVALGFNLADFRTLAPDDLAVLRVLAVERDRVFVARLVEDDLAPRFVGFRMDCSYFGFAAP